MHLSKVFQFYRGGVHKKKELPLLVYWFEGDERVEYLWNKKKGVKEKKRRDELLSQAGILIF